MARVVMVVPLAIEVLLLHQRKCWAMSNYDDIKLELRQLREEMREHHRVRIKMINDLWQAVLSL